MPNRPRPLLSRWLRATVLTLASVLALAAAACAGSEAGPEGTAPAVLVGGPDVSGAETAPPGEEADSGDEQTESEPTPEPTLVSLDWLADNVSVPGLDGGVASPTLDQALQSAVADALAPFGGNPSAVVHNLADGRYAAVNETATWYAASTFKAAVLLEAYRQRDAGEIDFATEVVLEEKYAENDLGTLEYLEIKVNDKVTIGDAVKGMIVVSDTPLALLVIDQLDSNRIDATLDEIGTSVMTLSDRALPTTALDLTQLLIAISTGYGVTPASRDQMLSLMAQEWFTEGIIAGLPAGATYAHKSGRFDAAVHDSAIVWGPAGPYVITVMTDGASGWEPIAAASAAVYNHFAANP